MDWQPCELLSRLGLSTLPRNVRIRLWYCYGPCCHFIHWIADSVSILLLLFLPLGEFKALAKLLTGLKLYREQEYILDILYDNDQFETILSAVRSAGSLAKNRPAYHKCGDVQTCSV